SNAPKPRAVDEVPEVPLALVWNPYLDELWAGVRGRVVGWEGYHRAGLITKEELNYIHKVDRKRGGAGSTIFTAGDAVSADDGPLYAQMYMSLLHRLSRVDTVQSILVLVDEMLKDHDERVTWFHQAAVGNPDFPYGPFLKCLHLDDEFVPLDASRILTTLYCASPNPIVADMSQLSSWLQKQLQSNNASVVDLAVQVLESLLQIKEYRKKVWDNERLVDTLVGVLKRNTTSPQMQYQVIFCFWLLTFEREVAATINKKYDIIPMTLEICKAAIKEKVVRVIIATFRNLVEIAPEANLPAMLVAKLLPYTENLSARKWSDSEIAEDVNFVKEQLTENFQSLSTFEEYASEVQTGKLEWSPPHQSETFWKQNASRLNENDHELVKILARLLSTSQDPLVLAVAAHDIGQYVKFGQKDAKKYVQDIGAKQKVMELMTHPDKDVRYQALLAVQKYMVNAWEF
ncbi:hypothetical protein BZG36_04613, partial [Bifiguratus adelaidae]